MAKINRHLNERITDSVCFPDNCLCGADIHIIGRRELRIEGCHAILDYNTEEIMLRMRDFVLVIKGQGLCMKSYYRSFIMVRGRIRSVTLEEG